MLESDSSDICWLLAKIILWYVCIGVLCVILRLIAFTFFGAEVFWDLNFEFRIRFHNRYA